MVINLSLLPLTYKHSILFLSWWKRCPYFQITSLLNLPMPSSLKIQSCYYSPRSLFLPLSLSHTAPAMLIFLLFLHQWSMLLPQGLCNSCVLGLVPLTHNVHMVHSITSFLGLHKCSLSEKSSIRMDDFITSDFIRVSIGYLPFCSVSSPKIINA